MLYDNGITNEFEAYLAGFLYADGYIDKRNALIINLSIKDELFLQTLCDILNKELNKNYKLKYIQSTNAVRLSIYSINFIKNLQKIGIKNRKTYDKSSYIFDSINDKYLKIHFIRGYYDGDGGIHKRKSGQYQISITSLNNILLNSILNFIKKELGINTYRKLSVTNVYNLSISGNILVKQLLDILYNNASIYLLRKYVIYTTIPIYKNTCASKYKYITYSKSHKKWRLRMTINNRRIHFGLFDTEIDALNMYNLIAKKYGYMEQI